MGIQGIFVYQATSEGSLERNLMAAINTKLKL
jgi:hypothetical protein